jgi:TolB-like protein/DNA-binding winged helix-turn-helix (wHTH) protein/Tfp pilus assembly protein PilF
MEAPATSRQCVRFGAFELDLRSDELRKHGNKVKLQGQPLKILAILLARPGEMVTREELRKELWPEDTFVDFDSGLNSAIKRLREALGDSRESSQFIETLPRRGYRFIAPVDEAESAAPGPGTSYEPPVQVLAGRRLSRYRLPVMVGAGVLALLFILTYGARWRETLGAETRPHPGTGQQSIQSLAVLPLENLSSDPDQEYFAEGMTDALTTDLAKISTLKVISRTSSMQFKGTKKPLQQIAKELNVDALVEGTVERSGSRVRITAQLIDVRNDRNLWAESYERDLRDVLALQSQVARAIASEIKVDLQPQEQARLATVRQVDPEAEIAYLRGLYEMHKWTREGFKEGFRYFQQAVQEDPTFAEAWAGLADAYFEWGQFGIAPLAETLPKERAAAQKALELDETLSEAHVSVLATTNAAGGLRSVDENEIQRAIALDPSNAQAHQLYGIYLRYYGRFDQSLAELERAEELDPLTPKKKNNLGVALYFVGRYDEALEWFHQVPDPDLDSERRHRRMAEIYEHKGMQKEAIAEFVASLRFGAKADLAARVEQSYLSSGYAEAKETLLRGEVDWAEKQAKSGTVPANAFWIARDYAILGDKDKAIGWVEIAYQSRKTGVEDYKVDPQLADLRSDPRVQELARRFDPRP